MGLTSSNESYRFVIDRELLDYKKIATNERKRSREEQNLVSRMRIFARFHSKEEHNAFVEGLLKAKRMRKKIEELQMYRKLGLRTLAEAQAFETARKNRLKETAGKESHADLTRLAKNVADSMRKPISKLQSTPLHSPILLISICRWKAIAGFNTFR